MSSHSFSHTFMKTPTFISVSDMHVTHPLEQGLNKAFSQFQDVLILLRFPPLPPAFFFSPFFWSLPTSRCWMECTRYKIYKVNFLSDSGVARWHHLGVPRGFNCTQCEPWPRPLETEEACQHTLPPWHLSQTTLRGLLENSWALSKCTCWKTCFGKTAFHLPSLHPLALPLPPEALWPVRAQGALPSGSTWAVHAPGPPPTRLSNVP
jgi:hypothetical protein